MGTEGVQEGYSKGKRGVQKRCRRDIGVSLLLLRYDTFIVLSLKRGGWINAREIS